MESQYGIGVQASSGIASIAALMRLSWRAVIENLTPNLAGSGEHGPGVERRVRAHRQRPGRAGVAQPRHRLGQERLGAAGRARRPAPQPGENHLPGLGQRRELGVIAADLGVAVVSALLGPAVDLADRGVQIDRQRPGRVGRSGAGGPEPPEQPAGDRVQLADVGPLERPQPGPDRRGRPGLVEQLGHRPGPQQRDVVDGVTAGEHRPHHRERLRAAVRAVLGQAHPSLDQLGQPNLLGQRRRRQQARCRHQIRFVVADRDPRQLVRCSHSVDALPLGPI